MLILLMKIANSVTWIRNHILQMHDEYDELRRISDDIYTQGLRITESIDELGYDPNAEPDIWTTIRTSQTWGDYDD